MYELLFVAGSNPAPMRWRDSSKCENQEGKTECGAVCSCTTPREPLQPVRRHAKFPAKAIPELAFISPAEAQLDTDVPQSPRA